MFVGIIMAGGRGERFWPKSRKENPKQLLDVFTGTPLIKESMHLIAPSIKMQDSYIITNKIIASKIKSILPKLPAENIIAEPIGRNTSAAIGVMAIYLRKKYGNPTMLVMTADHLIPNRNDFIKHITAAQKVAEKYQSLVTFGIQPTYPETGFGYIQSGKILEKTNGIPAYKIDRFQEKPDLATAKKYVKSSKYYWNSGMFCWTCNAILSAFEVYMPELYAELLKIEKTIGTKKWPKILDSIYPELPSVPIDKGIMEKADNAIVLKSNFQWNDIGSWVTMELIRPKDECQNVKLGNVLTVDSKNNIIMSDKQLVATLGINDLIVVATGDTIMVCPKNRAQDIRQIIQALDKDPARKRYL